ncbi:MAG: hypothetical protein G01um101470_542 [Parcubacteria group bacterium Gr01-1014_70]|nr:MAG: hypothetical protein G01um101470_542 [Parcubacteria group bacterium Gr01-1014_70]
MAHKLFYKKDGFTLIELLVVIAIIGVLASVVLATTNTARSKARDARRRAAVQQVKLALEFYYDTNNVYPPVGCVDCGTPWSGLAAPLLPPIYHGLMKIPVAQHGMAFNMYGGLQVVPMASI